MKNPHDQTNYWIRTSDGFYGPFASRRKALRVARRLNHFRLHARSYFEWATAPRQKINVRKGQCVVHASDEQVRSWEESMYIESELMASAR